MKLGLGLGVTSRFAWSARRAPPAPPVTLGTLGLSATRLVLGTAASGTITGATAGSAITASGLPAGFTINSAARTWAWTGNGNEGTPSITMTETLANATNSPHATTLALQIAQPPATLGALSLSDSSFIIGTPASGAINGASPNSVITASGLPTGFTINSAARTWSYDGRGAVGTTTITLTETLAGAVGNPRQTSLDITYAAVTGSLLRLEVLGTKSADDSGGVPSVNGWVAALRFKGMGRRHPINDPLCDPSSLAITVQDPGFDATGAPVTVTRTVRGTLPLINTFPRTWTSIGSGGTVPPRSWCCNGTGNANIYYTEAGGTRGATAPTHTTIGQSVSDGGVIWRYMDPNTIAGYQEAVTGDDVDVYVALDFPIFAGSTITAVAIGSGAYSVGGVATRSASATPTMVNSSSLAYEMPAIEPVTPPHLRSTGTFNVEWVVGHAWGDAGGAVACIKAQAFNAARSVSSPQVTVATPSLSSLITTASPAGTALEVYRAALDTSGLGLGDGFVEVEVYPRLGTRVFRSRYEGDGGDWQANTANAGVRRIYRNGGNLYTLVTAGTSGATGPTGTGTNIADGTCVWNYLAADTVKALSRNIQARHHFVNDTAGDYTRGYCFVDPSGTATGTAGVFSTYAAAYAAKGTLSNCYPTILAAATALQTFHNTAATGKTVHNDPGGGEMYLKAGTYSGFGGTMQSLNIGREWLYTRVDPDAAAGAVIFSYNATAGNRACHRRHWIEGTATTFATGTAIDPASDGTLAQGVPATELWLNRLAFTGTDATSQIASRAGIAWLWNSTVTNGGILAGNSRAHWGHVAGCNFTGATNVAVRGVLACRMSGNGIVRDPGNGGAYIPPSLFHVMVDSFISGSQSGRSGTTMVELLAGAYQLPVYGAWIAGNVGESTSSSGNEPVFRIAADASTGDLVNVVFAYNHAVGERYNTGYNDQAATPLRSQFYDIGNVTQTRNTVSSYFAHAGSTKGVGRFQQLWATYRVGSRDNVSHQGSGSGGSSFNQSTSAPIRDGLNSSWGQRATTTLQSGEFVNDKSWNRGAGNNGGNGDYRPAAGALARGRAVQRLRRFDIYGATRLTGGAAAVGALEAA